MPSLELKRPDLMDSPLEQIKALSHDLRFEIVSILAQRECCVCEIEVLLCLSQSKVSYHLAALRDVGLVSSRQRGKNIFYKLERQSLYVLGGRLLETLLKPRPDLGLTNQTELMC